IDQQEKLLAEILSRREKFTTAVMHATSIDELRLFSTHRDSLRGYIFREFADRALPDLEDEAQRNGKSMDEPSFFALRLRIEFIHARNQDVATATDGTQKRSLAIWDAVETQDVSLLSDSDLPELKRIAGMEWTWLFRQQIKDLPQG